MTCPGPSGRDDSFGRRRREAGDAEDDAEGDDHDEGNVETSKVELREMFRVYESRESMPSNDVSGALITGQEEIIYRCVQIIS